MLRELVQWVLNNYLSNYVENLSVDQLSIAILQGEVELENVPLRKDALRRLGLPLEVRAGLIGRVRLRIPVHQIRAAPWLIQFEQLYLVAGPYRPDEWDAQQEEAARQEWKLRRLDSLEASWRARHQQPTDAGFYSSSCSSWLSYTSGLVANIVENLQLQVREIHIRYEDDTTLPGVSLAAGLTLGELSAQTCNYQWMPGYVSLSESAKDAFKLVDLKGAALYWDTNASMFGHLSLQDLAVAMKVSMRRSDSFVLDPVSAQAKLKRNRSEQQLRSRSQPRIVCDLSLEAMNLTLNDVQYGQIVGLARGLEQLSQQREAQLSQSSCPSHMELSATWRWAAYRALTLSRVSALYRDLYVQYLQSPNSLPADLKSLKDVIEVRYCYEALREVREAAMQVAAQHTRDSATASSGSGRGLLLQWFPLWSGWYASTPAQQLRSPNEEEEGLEQELLQALKESQVQEDSPLTRDAVLAVTSMTLQRGSLRLIASDRPANHPVAEEDETEQRAKSSGHAVLELELEQLTMKAELRPRFNSRCFSFSVGGVYLKDCITRNSLYPMVIEPQQHRDGWQRTASVSVRSPEPLFTLLFEVRPLGVKVDYRLHVESRSLAIVYNPSVVQAVADFFAHGHTTSHNPAWRKRYENMKRKTKERILQNWEQMLEGDQRERTKWDLKLNVSAPQILFAESFCDKSATVVLIDFGKLNVRNIQDGINIVVSPARQPSEEEDECFHTPCSSPQIECKSPSFLTPKHDLSESALHQKMYDRFSIELGDMQILVGRTRDNLKHAHHKGTSTLHVLDRFNISIMLESRALYSNDPNLPSLKISGSLPKLVVHINEQKVAAIRSMVHHMQGEGLPSPFRTQDFSPVHQADVEEATQEARTVNENANLLVLRFCIDDMSLEVQSRGRPVAELQVRGVHATLYQRPYETNASLSVHSLLLVDAMQTYGNDFDLLVASHQRVGMDSISGSLRDSEPTSPTSPISSPDPSRGRSTSPLALSQALRSLQARAASPPPLDILEPPDMEALIYVEILSLSHGCPSLEPGETSRHVATVNCNCLDLIANQETVVELVGFVHRLFPESKSVGGKFMAGSSIDNLTAEPMAKIELIFEFQRLNVLLLRAIIKDNKTQARKIATATLTEAKIQATVGNDLVIKGSLGGVQVLDLTPEGQKHQRILSLGHDPLVCSHHSELLHRLTAELSSMYIHSSTGCRQTTDDEVEAFCFSFTRPLDDTASTEINLRMASVWYTHSPHFLSELQSCATEFKQYVASLARSIRLAATEMAIGLVHARSEAMAERLYSSRGSLAGLDMSPQRRRRRSISQSLEFLENKFNTPYSPDEDVSSTDMIMDMKVDIVLESPVIVLPRSQTSNDVFVAHLGKITLNDHQNQELPSTAVSPDSDSQGHYCWGLVRRRAKYELEVRNMSLASLNVSGRQSSEVQRADVLYSCATDATPILHDTLLKLSLELERGRCVMRPTSESLPSLLMDQSLDFLDVDSQDVVQVRGCVVRSLQVSLSRFQYEQLLDCVDLLTSGIEHAPSTPDPSVGFSLDPSLRTRLLGAQPLPATTPVDHRPTKHKFILGVLFELPELRVTLRDNLRGSEQDKVLVSFGDFVVKYDKSDPFETSIKMSLRSLVVEDLSQPEDSAHRKLVVSQFLSEEELLDVRNVPLYASRSCPDISTTLGSFKKRGSLPDILETSVLYGVGYKPNQTQPIQMSQPSGECPVTPPPSPRRTGSPKDQMARKDNLVHIDVLLIDPKSPDFFSKYNTNQRYVDVNFNCLDVIVNIESWVLILDFFGMTEQQEPVKEATPRKPKIVTSTPTTSIKLEETTNSEIDFKVRSLTLVLARVSGGELARANVAQLTARIEKRGSESVISGKLGKLSLTDLTPHGRLYRERFTTTGGLDFNIRNYSKPDPSMTREFDTQVNLRMCSVHYVHTQRFIEELKTQFTHFSFLQTFVSKLRAATAGFEGGDNSTRGRRVLWDIQTASPVILLPLSSRSNQVLVANLGELTVTNKFQLKIHESSSCLIDIMSIDLINMNIYSGLRITSLEPHSEVLHLGIGTYIEKISDTFLNEKCHLQLKVERNLDSLTCHPVPDISSHGTLSTLHAVLSVEEYKLIRGFLAQNLGENLDDIEDLLPVQSGPTKVDSQYQLDLVWVLNCLKLDLHNVAVDLKDADKEPLACINFIKCRLVIESRSDGSRDIDLVSKEILISDTRFVNQPVNKRTNVFTNILQPVDITKRSSQVQAEIHHRRRIDSAQFTILLNNMRLMLILDWWELVREFIWTEPENCEVINPTTKPMTVVEPDETPYELKLNVTDSEIVIVEETSQSDTNAVILKSTTVVTYRPNLKERPLSCNLNRCELFYCILGLEEDTALSIVDPVTVNMEILQRANNTMGLEVSLQHMSLRLSYHDFRMFSKMLVSLPKQTKGARKQSVSDKSKEKPVNIINQINKLQGLGFSAEDCAVALDKCKGKLDDAALWLTQHAPHMEPSSPTHSDTSSGLSCFNIEGIEVKADVVSVCLIDDCRDSDVPFLEFSLTKLCLCQELNPHEPARYFDKGSMRSIMTTDYYNRHLSGWEPLIEPWKCDFAWENPRTMPVFQLSIISTELLCINITNSLLQLFQTIKESWTEDYLAITRSRADSHGFRRRSPFVPFEIHNDTGSDLWFTTNVKLADHFDSVSQDPANSEVWKFVAKGETQPFSFQTQRLKLRHRHTHEMKLHQVKVRIEGWQTISPVSIDKVGSYFRFAQPDLTNKDGNVPSARVVFQVTTEGTAKKLITVRSALLITNQLTCPINLSMDNRGFNHNVFEDYVILPNKTYSVPLPLVHSTLRVTPMAENQSYQCSSSALQWYHVTEPGTVKEDVYCCRPSNAHSGEYGFRFTLAVRREMYPPESKQYHNWQEHRQLTYMYPQPAHTLTILSPIVVDNLLPSELECSVGLQTLRISPGKVASINLIDISQSISLKFLIENFTSPGHLELQPYGGSTKLSNVLLTDQQGRALQLLAKVTVKSGKGISIAVSAPYWLLNRTGLPLVFKQEGASTDAAGQGSEHEMARMVTPLLFSLSDPDHGAGLAMRLGNGVHKGGRPEWCAPLLPRRDVQLRPLRVCTSDARSDHVYQIGISSKAGKGRYHRTTMIHFVPHFLLHNKSSFELQFAQSCLATTVADPGAQATFLRAVPGCCLPFHWPKLDRDQRLCVLLLDVLDCMWSGAFCINRSDLFHLNIRDKHGGMNFILVEVSQRDASSMVTFSDASTLPPPVRVDNFAEVPIFFHQVGIRGQQSAVRPHCSIPYAWDEPIQAKRIAFTAPGGNEAVFDFSILKGQEDLTYENFIYLALTWTFPAPGSCPAEELRGQQLVLAVPEGENRVVLQRKEAGCRAQLWRMTAAGQLQHEGSSPPRDPRREPTPQNALVLDIAGVAPQPSQYVPLVVRKPDPRRQSTQTWRFTEEGRLCCVHNNMCVQAKDGFFGLRKGLDLLQQPRSIRAGAEHVAVSSSSSASTWQMWSEVVLGPPQPTCHQRTESGVPVEQAVSRQRLRPGSGILSLRLIADGPTRVLEITDKKAKNNFAVMQHRDWSHFTPPALQLEPPRVLQGLQQNVLSPGVSPSAGWEVRIKLEAGIGASLVDTAAREELAFCLLRGFSSRFAVDRAGVQKLVVTILDVQVDNQMFEAQCPVVVYVPTMDRETAEFEPVIEIVAVRSTSGHHNIDTVQELAVVIRSMNITIEEEQLLRVVSLLGLGAPEAEPDSTATAARAEPTEYDTPHIGHASASAESVSRYFVAALCIKPEQIRLGAVPCSKLPPGLNQLRRRLGLTLIKFEDAAVDLQPLQLEHTLLSHNTLLEFISRHFQQALRTQLPVIIFSADLLGGPAGLFTNVSDGVIDVLNDPGVRSVGDLVKNVTHGISNSAAKVTGSLSDGISRVALDESHNERRLQIRRRPAGSSSGLEHIKFGFESFALGVFGGATSIFTQTYESVAADGPPGLITGIGKGLVGTVMRPVTGALDLASAFASAVRDSSRGSRRGAPCRFRLPRCVVGPGGLLPVYSAKQSEGQQFLHQSNSNPYSEIFMAYETLRSVAEDLRVIVSNEAVRVFTCNQNGVTEVIKVHLGELINCRYVMDTAQNMLPLHYIELTEKVLNQTSGEMQTRRPQVRCDTEDIAKWVCQQINYAKGMYEERIRTLVSQPGVDD